MQIFQIEEGYVDEIHKTFTGAHLALQDCLKDRQVVRISKNWFGPHISGYIRFWLPDGNSVAIWSRYVRD